ncbi:GyrI-like domain-containing protein [Oceanotoga sp. DSM 15011]|uniref:AraC family transcriptional regulator n=1 Tax=Oceanotoga sp. DSM 15011 TaxID=2984951 RepID=UPI0021F4716B|nr:GyrI-like domain-containing protein [Oceanotoga sp. DSM 15011]UYP00808.1 GyrI-like domain-containing protein [Oceanotoga sp. DSM 15011]
MKKSTQIDWHKKVSYSLVRLIEGLNDNISFQDIAEEVYSSPYHFHKVFKKLTGETVNNCVKRLRLERSSIYLIESNFSIEKIAYLSGYDTSEGFSKAFKKAYGLQPSIARKNKNWNYRLFSKSGIHYEKQPSGKWFFLNKGDENNMDIKIVDLEIKKLIYLPGFGNYWTMPQKWQEFHQILNENRLYPKEACFMSMFFDHSDDIDWNKKRWGVCMSIPKKIKEDFGLKYYETPGGMYAILTHQGSYEEIGNIWDKWRKEWLPNSGWKFDSNRPSFEWYQNSFTQVQPELLITYLCDPVIKVEL